MDDKYRGHKFYGEEIVDVDAETDEFILSNGRRLSRMQADRIIAVRDKLFKIPIPGNYSISTGRAYGKSSLPLDNMKLDATGVWSNSESDDPVKSKWTPWIYDWNQKPDAPEVHPVVACDRVWIDVGFQFSKFVCSKCNSERKD